MESDAVTGLSSIFTCAARDIPRAHSLLRKLNGFVDSTHPSTGGDDMNSSQNQREKSSETTTSLETIIAVGLFGWLALSMTLMGLGIW